MKWRPNPTERAVLASLATEGKTYAQLETITGMSRRTLQRAVARLAKARRVKAPSRSRGEPWTLQLVTLAKR